MEVQLTPREEEVKRMLARGLPPRAIAAILDISEEAVERVRGLRPAARREDEGFDWWLSQKGK